MESHDRRVLSPGEPVPAGVTDAGQTPSAPRVQALLTSGVPVLVELVSDDTEPDPGLLAAASVYAWLGVTVFRAPDTQHPALVQVLDMVASVEGSRPPALSRRGLA
ncbi:hypothetical protein [Spirillospora sp. CA-294931]|uniref:hypothetical protein n=1 Tax=Spirillospora sp. CA-294931 TaxID=3240042 RepID=UPI003D912257